METSVTPITTPDPAQVTALATASLMILRRNGLKDDEIRDRYLTADAPADDSFEHMQRTQVGRVVAPAAHVKAEMKRLLAN